MVTRIIIALVLLATVAQAQVVRKILRPDLGAQTNGTGMVLWLPMEGKMYDLAANAPSGVTGSPSFPLARLGAGISTTNANYGVVTNASSWKVNGLSTISVSFWMSLKQVPANDVWQLISSCPNGSPDADSGWQIYWDNRNAPFCGGANPKRFNWDLKLSGGTRSYVTPNNSVADTEWHHIVAVFDNNNATRMFFYVDAVSLSLTVCSPFSGTGTISDNAQNLGIGATPSGGAQAQAFIDDVRVFNRALSAAEVKSMYSSRRPTQ